MSYLVTNPEHRFLMTRLIWQLDCLDCTDAHADLNICCMLYCASEHVLFKIMLSFDIVQKGQGRQSVAILYWKSRTHLYASRVTSVFSLHLFRGNVDT